MKRLIFNVALALAAVLGISSCGYDNMDEPETTVTGNIQYNGQNLQLRGTSGAVCVELYQPGYALKAPISVYVDQDGRFSAKLFKGQYKLVTKDNNGPWVNSRDTIVVDVNGATNVDVPVTPYFLVSEATATLNGNTVTAHFKIDRIVPEAVLQDVYLCFGHTMLCDAAQNDFRIDVSGTELQMGDNTVTRTLTDAQMAKANSIGYTKLVMRLGVKSSATSECIYSPMIQLR